MSRSLPVLCLLTAAMASPAAHACGGFFCSSATPVVQDAERIAFAIDERSGQVEAHIQIFYDGPADDFAWIVPVQGNPDVFLSSDALFDTLSLQLAPTFQLNFLEEGRCGDGVRLGFAQEFAMDASAGGTTMSGPNGVEVTQQGQVGPYDMVVLKGDSTEELLGWLVDNGYDLAPGMEPLLAPYVSEDAHFLALKLQKDRDDGDIAPIGFRYRGDRPAVPIQLTSVAAAPDMRLEAYVFANQRAVPESYLHVQINEAAVDWWSGGQNYPDVITKAANEAGGHAFATDFAGTPDFLRGQLYDEARIDLDFLATRPTFDAFVQEVRAQGIQPTAQLQNALLACVDAPAGVDPVDFLNCPECVGYDSSTYDAQACADLLDVAVVEPLEHAENLFLYPWVSRMTSSLDAVEMTVDPVFVQNPDMGRVSNQHSADLVWECTGGKKRDKALRRLELADGRAILLPSTDWLAENNLTEFEFLEDFGEVNAQVIEATSGSGDPEVLTDLTSDLFAQADAHNEMVLGLSRGCGCSTSSGSTGGLWLVGLAALGLVRRRRADRS